jgi:hypothetical protein
MSELLLCWRKGNKKIYTKRLDIAEKAMKEGYFVKVLRNSPYIFRY